MKPQPFVLNPSPRFIARAARGVALAASAFLVQNVFAGYVVDAKITSIRATEYQAIFVCVDKTIIYDAGNAVPCVTQTNVFALDNTTPGGKAIANNLALALQLKRKITIQGAGSFPDGYPPSGSTACSMWLGVETINYIEIGSE